MNAHQTIAALFALARNCGRASKDYEQPSADHEVTETAAVLCAKLALELEHAHHLEAPPAARPCVTCKGARVAHAYGRGAIVCPDCDGRGFVPPIFVVALVALALAVMTGCGGAEFTVEPTWVDAGAGDAVSFAEVIPAPDAQAPDAPTSAGPQSPNDGSAVRSDSSDDAGASLRDAGTISEAAAPPLLEASAPDAAAPPLCNPMSCPPCGSLAYACCLSETACGCESPSEGGQCR